MARLHHETDFRVDGFNTTEVKPNFINPGCFGEDLVAALAARVRAAAPGIEIGEPIQEDYGWGFWATRDRDPYWVAATLIAEEPDDEAVWKLFVDYDPGLSLVRRLFGRPDPEGYRQVVAAVEAALRTLPGYRRVEG